MNHHHHCNKIALPIDFTPTSQYVVVGKGKKFCQHPGNLRLRNMVQSKLSMYLNAHTKASKSSIISSVVDNVRSEGDFVQLDKNTGRWVQTTDYLAREKTSQAFRDALRHYYKSSRENKRKSKVMLDNETDVLPINPLFTTGAPPHQHKRRRTDKTSSSASVSSLEFPTFPTPSSLSSCPNLIPSMVIDFEESNDDDLHKSIFSLLSHDAVIRATTSATNDVDDPFEPTPIIEENDVLQPISIDLILGGDNQESHDAMLDYKLLQSALGSVDDVATMPFLRRIVSQ